MDEKEWETSISPLFNQSEKVSELSLNSIILSEAKFNKLFEEDLSNLTVLNLTKVVMTRPMIQMLLAHRIFYEQLQTLVLDNCNLNSDDFSIILPSNSTLKVLSLSSNKYFSPQTTTSKGKHSNTFLD